MAPITKNMKLNILPKQPYFSFAPIPAQKTRPIIANATLSGAANTMQQAISISSVSSISYLHRFEWLHLFCYVGTQIEDYLVMNDVIVVPLLWSPKYL